MINTVNIILTIELGGEDFMNCEFHFVGKVAIGQEALYTVRPCPTAMHLKYLTFTEPAIFIFIFF